MIISHPDYSAKQKTMLIRDVASRLFEIDEILQVVVWRLFPLETYSAFSILLSNAKLCVGNRWHKPKLAAGKTQKGIEFLAS